MLFNATMPEVSGIVVYNFFQIVLKTKNLAISNEALVVWGGIEPPTQGFSVLCSTD
jgi:hypothetical protein